MAGNISNEIEHDKVSSVYTTLAAKGMICDAAPHHVSLNMKTKIGHRHAVRSRS